MPARQSRCEARMRGTMVFGLLSVACAIGASPISAQTMSAPGADMGGAPAAPPMNENAEGAPALAIPIGRPFGFTHDEYVDLSETYETNALGLGGYSPNTQSGTDAFTTLSLGIGLHEHTLRLTGDLQYSLSGVAYARHS